MPEEPTPRQLQAIFDLLGVDESTALKDGNPEKIVAWLYRILDTIDSKTSHLLQINAIVLAVQIYLVNGIVGAASVPWWLQVASAVSLVVPFLGMVWSESVFRVKWPFLGWRPRDTQLVGTVESAMRHEFNTLARVCDTRTERHSRVWWFSLVSIGLMIALFCIRFGIG